MSDGVPDEGVTRAALRRAAGAAADDARPPDVADLRRRVRRRRSRAVAGAVGVVVAGLLGVPALVAAVDQPPARGPVVAGPSSPSTDPASASPAPSSAGPSEDSEPVQPTGEPTTGTRRVKLFLLRERAGQQCPQVVPVTRDLPAQGVAKQALRALLEGPTEAERAAGLTSVFDRDSHRFQYLKLDGPRARADFTDLDGILDPGDTCEKTKLLEPMQRTLEQFKWIEEARFSIRGDQRAFYVDVLHDRVPN
ncbi:GerMN domain-containing protein [Micromonospora coxensis]|uniref:Sporulation and spore germination n=1 Tax=Micromonospora coxensis TaxID=356852 RepID=A0A1C5GU59_9ACTN|nr:GerMN domain-containing protein [Micromonospora coxensis]SCG37304.1 Sporulation and spore germination [Micromonospora coxensis]